MVFLILLMLKQQVSSTPGYKNDADKERQWFLHKTLHTCRLVAACISLAELGFLVQVSNPINKGVRGS